MRQIIKNGADDKSHKEVPEELRKSQRRITLQSPEPSTEAELDLAKIRKGVRTLDSLVFRLLSPSRLFEPVKKLATNGVSLIILINFLEKSSSFLAFLPDFCEIIWGAGYSVLKTWSYDTFERTGHRGQEIGGGLAVRAIEAESLKVSLSFAARTKVDLTAFIEHNNLIEYLMHISNVTSVERDM